MMNESFDVSRAHLVDEPQFKPFFVKQTRPLSETMAAGRVSSDDMLLVLEREAGVIAFDMIQMAYHHTAQGELAGEPWLVTF